MSTLHVFIDESGQHHGGDCYAVAGCWCVSPRRDVSEVLKPTKSKLMGMLEADHPSLSEIKSSSLGIDEIELLLQCLTQFVHKDQTLDAGRYPWQSAHPLQISLHDTQPDVAVETLSGMIGELQVPETIQTLALISLLNPLFSPGVISLSGLDQVQVTLDSKIWERAATKVDDTIDRLGASPIDIHFETWDSKKAPGLQVADLCANTWRRSILNGVDNDGSTVLTQLRL